MAAPKQKSKFECNIEETDLVGEGAYGKVRMFYFFESQLLLYSVVSISGLQGIFKNHWRDCGSQRNEGCIPSRSYDRWFQNFEHWDPNIETTWSQKYHSVFSF